VLGWRNKPGEYVFPGYTTDAPPIHFTLWPDGSRATQPHKANRPDRVLVLGDSFTQGWAVSDHETYAWKLQERFPAWEFLNYGTAGYSTYQALLILERYLAVSESPPKLVVYGFNDGQEGRNVAPFAWMNLLTLASRKGHVEVPYCLLGADGRLQRHSPERYPMWPFKTRSATVTFAEEWYERFKTRNRSRQARTVAELLVDEMNRASVAAGSKLLVVLLAGPVRFKAHYTEYLEDHGIESVNCGRHVWPPMIVPGEGHPNGMRHTLWANCIAERLRRGLLQ